MDQVKIGNFISKMRKEKNLTQLQLAEKLGVTDRSISNWENGKNMPDYSILIPLSNELGVTLNELFYGDKISTENLKEITDQNLNKLLLSKYKNKILLRRAITGGFIAILLFLLLYKLF